MYFGLCTKLQHNIVHFRQKSRLLGGSMRHSKTTLLWYFAILITNIPCFMSFSC